MSKTLKEWYGEEPTTIVQVPPEDAGINLPQDKISYSLPQDQQKQFDALKHEQDLKNALDKTKTKLKVDVYKTLGLAGILSQKLAYFLEVGLNTDDLLLKDKIKVELIGMVNEMANIVSEL